MGREGSLFRTMILFLVLLLSNTLFTTVTGDYPTDILTSNTHNQGYSPITTVTPDPITTVWPTDCHQFQEDKVCVIHSVLDVVDELLGTDGKSCQAEWQNNPHCQFFTWVVLGEEDNRCYLLYTGDSKQDCPDTCSSSLAGPKYPNVEEACCSEFGDYVCDEAALSRQGGVHHDRECQDRCRDTLTCTHWTRVSDLCLLFSSCNSTVSCSCSSGPIRPSVDICRPQPSPTSPIPTTPSPSSTPEPNQKIQLSN